MAEYKLRQTGEQINTLLTNWKDLQVQADATAADIAQGKKAVTNDGLVTGTMEIAGKDPIPIVTTSGTGSAYTATVDNIVELAKGLMIVIIPHISSATATPTLNVNGLGAKTIKRRYSHSNSSAAGGYGYSWLNVDIPQLLQYDGTYWITIGNSKPYGPDMYGSVGVANGGTGKASWTAYRLPYPSSSTAFTQLAFPSTAGSFLRQGTSGAPYWTAPKDVLTAIGAAEASHNHDGQYYTEAEVDASLAGKLDVTGDAASVNGLKLQALDAVPTTLPANTIAFVFEEA